MHAMAFWPVPLCFALAGCMGVGPASHSCTEMGCTDGYQVDFRSASSSWAAGTYHIGIVADGQSITCAATLPFESQSPPHDCSSPDVMLGVSGTALPAAQHALTGLVFSTHPANVTITISLDGKPFASAALAPAYATSRPNGPDCEPVCTSASDVVPVP
jgi:hypothetical protein